MDPKNTNESAATNSSNSTPPPTVTERLRSKVSKLFGSGQNRAGE